MLYTDAAAKETIERMKAHGYWSERFDRSGIPQLFSEIPAQTINKVANALVAIMDNADPASILLSERAHYWARTHGVSFGEALSQVKLPPGQWLSQQNVYESPVDTQRNKEAELESSKRALDGGLITQQMYDLAWKYANVDGIRFKQAMVRVSAEHPEWFSALVKKQIERGEGQWGCVR
jgi:hypothetical protein